MKSNLMCMVGTLMVLGIGTASQARAENGFVCRIHSRRDAAANQAVVLRLYAAAGWDRFDEVRDLCTQAMRLRIPSGSRNWSVDQVELPAEAARNEHSLYRYVATEGSAAERPTGQYQFLRCEEGATATFATYPSALAVNASFLGGEGTITEVQSGDGHAVLHLTVFSGAQPGQRHAILLGTGDRDERAPVAAFSFAGEWPQGEGNFFCEVSNFGLLRQWAP